MSKRLIKFNGSSCKADELISEALHEAGVDYETMDFASDEYKVVTDFCESHHATLSGKPVTVLFDDGKPIFIGVGYFDISQLIEKL